MPQQILLVEDEQEIADLLSLHLAGSEHQITHESCGERGMALALSRQWDLAILDRGLPKLDGVDICRALRQQSPDTGVILLTARDSEIDRGLASWSCWLVSVLSCVEQKNQFQLTHHQRVFRLVS